MTHSGGKPHEDVGDRGQRYEVRATGYPKEEQSVIGWADDVYVANEMANAIRKAPGCRATAIFDRREGHVVRGWRAPVCDPACLTLAEHMLQNEPTLQPRAEDLAVELERAATDWITLERE
jgi:hypothetical protein